MPNTGYDFVNSSTVRERSRTGSSRNEVPTMGSTCTRHSALSETLSSPSHFFCTFSCGLVSDLDGKLISCNTWITSRATYEALRGWMFETDVIDVFAMILLTSSATSMAPFRVVLAGNLKGL